MRVLLLHRDRDFDPKWQAPQHAASLSQDLDLGTLLDAMAGGDPFLLEVARKVLLSGPENDVDTVLHRQGALQDSLVNPGAVRALYALTCETLERKKRTGFMGVLSRHPGSVLYDGLEVMGLLVEMLGKARRLADVEVGHFKSDGFRPLFEAMRMELSDEYLATVRSQLGDLKFRHGLLLSARLGEVNEGVGHTLHRVPDRRRRWFDWLFPPRPRGLTVEVAPRDEAGLRALSELRDRGIDGVANALMQSCDHVAAFFESLRFELAFYVACLNLHEALRRWDAPVCFPRPAPAGERRHRFEGLYEPCLSLRTHRRVVGNALAAEGKSLGIVTGANQGGKSTYLRSLGLAQLMMQAGMFVAAESYAADLCTGLFTHFRREEDATMKSGKLDEELGRMSVLVDVLRPDALVLFNESFAATNEREGSEIATQVVSALVQRRIKVFFVTHMHTFARGLYDAGRVDAIFLRAERRSDGMRTFRLVEGEPLQTSFGVDVYREVFASEPQLEKAS